MQESPGNTRKGNIYWRLDLLPHNKHVRVPQRANQNSNKKWGPSMRVPQRANQNSSKKWGPCVMSATTEPIGIHLRTEVRFLKDPPTERVQSRILKSKFQFTCGVN